MATLTTYDLQQSELLIKCDENATFTYTATLLDDAGVAIPLSAIETLKLSLVNRLTGEVINSRDQQDVKNANDCTVHATSGLLTWQVQQEDTTFQADLPLSRGYEDHIATFLLTYNSTKDAAREFTIRVYDRTSIPMS